MKIPSSNEIKAHILCSGEPLQQSLRCLFRNEHYIFWTWYLGSKNMVKEHTWYTTFALLLWMEWVYLEPELWYIFSIRDFKEKLQQYMSFLNVCKLCLHCQSKLAKKLERILVAWITFSFGVGKSHIRSIAQSIWPYGDALWQI